MRKGTWSWGALLVTACLGLASGAARAQDSTEEQVVTRGMHLQVELPAEISRIAVGDPKTAEAEILDSKSVLVRGLETGRTSLLVWLSNGELRKFVLSVETDLTVLRSALAAIHPSITAQMAPDREAIVLRGEVPDSTYRSAAEQAASAYAFASSRGGDGRSMPVVQTPGGTAGGDTVRRAADDDLASSVINLIRVEKLPEEVEDRLSRAISDSGIAGVRVRRLQRGDFADDTNDILVLEGAVANQVQLTRVLHLASTMFLGTALDLGDVRATDESGGLLDSLSGQSGGDTPAGSVSSSTGGSGFSSSSGEDTFENLLGRNIARAKAVTIGKGRILSFLEVRDLPQVRIDVRFYEVNKTDLLQYAPDFALLFADFDQASLLPSPTGLATQGTRAGRVGDFSGSADVQGALSFLADGFTQQFQVSGDNVALDAVFRVLESKGIARALSGPSLTVLSGEQARFLVGGEIPVPQSFAPAFGSTDATTTPGVFNSVEFRSFGVELSIRPLAGEDDQITLDILTQVSAPDQDLTALVRDSTGTDLSTTAFETRSIGTSARLPDGNSLLMGGLTQRRQTDGAVSTPLLSDIPGLGWMFKRFSVQDEDFELVVVVSPVLVRSPIRDLSTWEFPELAEIFLQPPEFWTDPDDKVPAAPAPTTE